MSRWGIYISSLVVVLAGGYFLVFGKSVNFGALAVAVRAYPTKALVLGFVWVLLQVFFQICRFWALVPKKNFGWIQTGRIFTLGQILNCFAPARAGDFLKVVLFTSKKHPHALTLAQSTGVMLADKVIDVLSILLLCLMTGVDIASQGMALPRWFWPAFVVGLAALFGLVRIPAVRKKVAHAFLQLKDTLDPRRHPKRFVLALSFSLAAWICESMAIKTLCLGQNFPATFPQSVWALLTLNIGIAIPVSVANIGAHEAALTFALTRLGVSATSGLAVASMHHLFQIAGVIAWLPLALAGNLLLRKHRPVE